MKDTEFEAELRKTQEALDSTHARVDALLATLSLIETTAPAAEDSAAFEANFLRPYFESVGLTGAPRAMFDRLQARRRPVYALRAEAEAIAGIVRASPLFDADGYRARLKLGADLDAALHYVIVGEEAGHLPSEAFDPTYYGERYPDVAALPMNRLWHFETHGREERRRPLNAAGDITFPPGGFNPARKTVLIISHDSSRTGAPILAYNVARRLRQSYNVVALLLLDGELRPEFESLCNAVIGPIPYADRDPVELKYFVRSLLDAYDFEYAIANSIESRQLLQPLAQAHVPVVALVHEFASYTRPKGAMGEALDWATQVVFSTELTANAAVADYPTLSGRALHILPQGKCDAPGERPPTEQDVERLKKLIRPAGDEDAFVVLGMGTVQYRKGVDLFISCAAVAVAMNATRRFRFVWIGHGYDPDADQDYSSYLSEQVARSGLDDIVVIADPVKDIAPAYGMADALFLSSRLDPLPNVAIDAALAGLPIICFEGASGVAPLLAAEPELRACVAPHLDVSAAATTLVRFANDRIAHARAGEFVEKLARRVFNTDQYVSRVDALGREGVAIMSQRKADIATIRGDVLFDKAFFLGPAKNLSSRDEAIGVFVNQWAAVTTSRKAAKNGFFRRPFPGFHPQIYAEQNAGVFDFATENPLAHYIRNGKPQGPWLHDVIAPTAAVEKACGVRVALHAHLFYVELIADLMAKLACNASDCDVLLTTDTPAKAAMLERATSGYRRGAVVVRVVPNSGRDIGAFLTDLRDVLPKYDIVGHVHGKRTVSHPGVGERWREFLWQHLVGAQSPMVDVVLDRFARHARLGLVFAEDPHLSDWDENFDAARQLAHRLGVSASLPRFFDFPNGTMFWARREALQPLFDAKFGWSDYPEEPVPYDGTMLHALERLLPFVAQHQGFGFATTHVRGHVR